jgi:hypothetical protein
LPPFTSENHRENNFAAPKRRLLRTWSGSASVVPIRSRCMPADDVDPAALRDVKLTLQLRPKAFADFTRNPSNRPACGAAAPLISSRPSDELPKLIMRVEPDEQFINALDRELQIFNYFIDGVMEKIRAKTEVPVPQGSLALKAALRASLETAPD